jgi:hypothetical protein
MALIVKDANAAAVTGVRQVTVCYLARFAPGTVCDDSAISTREYPFVPKSNQRLRPGQYWAIPLQDGRFACGRVMAVPAFGAQDRVGFVAGLLDWIGSQPPTGEAIAGKPVLAQAKTRFEAIAKTGGSVLGVRALDLDGLVAIDPHDMSVGAVHHVWGWHAIVDKAERLASGQVLSSSEFF